MASEISYKMKVLITNPSLSVSELADPTYEYVVTFAKVFKGDKGDSAYDIAVLEGFQGTEEEWLASLVGAKGDQGKSAYDIWLEKGHTGTEEDFIASLKGEKGDAAVIDSYSIVRALGYTPANNDNVVHLSGAESISGVKDFRGGLRAGDKAISNVGEPSKPTDAATKGYVDKAVSEMDINPTFKKGIQVYYRMELVDFKDDDPDKSIALRADMDESPRLVVDAYQGEEPARIGGVAEPEEDDDVATKKYVDEHSGSIDESNLVHRTGNEEIDGYKTFKKNIVTPQVVLTDEEGDSDDVFLYSFENVLRVSGSVEDFTIAVERNPEAEMEVATKNYVDTEVSNKADKTYVDGQLQTKASEAELTELSLKVDSLVVIDNEMV